MTMAQKQSPAAKTIDYTPLTQVISKADIQAFLDSQGIKSKTAKLNKLITIVLVALFLIAISLTIIMGDPRMAGFIALIAFVIILEITMVQPYDYKRSVRLWYFALANKFSYRYLLTNPEYTGIIFQQGYNRLASNIIYKLDSDSSVSYEMGDYEYTTGAGKTQTTYNWFYISMRLDRKLPHMVLDSRSNNYKLFGKDITNLPELFSKDQVLSLEGDFNNHFTLYAPKKYERDALYIFTPDLMALLIDQSAQFDAEVIDDRIYFYYLWDSSYEINLDIVRQALAIINTVGMKVYRQTDSYADERVADRTQNTVAQGGQRLKRAVSWFTVIIILIIFAVWIIPNFVRH